jgi:hypothetical protein
MNLQKYSFASVTKVSFGGLDFYFIYLEILNFHVILLQFLFKIIKIYSNEKSF